MNIEEIQSLVLQYLEAMDCQILEKTPAYITVKLSAEADKDLTNRAYYWSFVERCGIEPETLTMKWVLDPAKLDNGKQPPKPAVAPPAGSSPNSDSVLAGTSATFRLPSLPGCRRMKSPTEAGDWNRFSPPSKARDVSSSCSRNPRRRAEAQPPPADTNPG